MNNEPLFLQPGTKLGHIFCTLGTLFGTLSCHSGAVPSRVLGVKVALATVNINNFCRELCSRHTACVYGITSHRVPWGPDALDTRLGMRWRGGGRDWGQYHEARKEYFGESPRVVKVVHCQAKREGMTVKIMCKAAL